MHHLAQLLPYDLNSKKNAALRSSLKEYKTLIQAALQAIHAIQNKDYEKFDGLVGENACEIRAIWLSWLFLNRPIHLDFLKQRLHEADHHLQSLLFPSSINMLMQNDTPFGLLLENEKLKIGLKTEELFFILSFILTEIKESTSCQASLYIKERVNQKKLLQYGEITPSFANNLISKLRKMLAAASVHFVREQAFAVQDPLLIKMVSDEFTITHNALPCIPMFWTYKTVLSVAQNENIPIIIHAKFLTKSDDTYTQTDEEKLLYQVDSNGLYQVVDPSLADLDRPACIVQGIACINETTWSKTSWLAHMNATSVIDIILAGAADHRQYPDPALDQMFDHTEDSDYALYKQRALAEGFAADNPSTFFIQHVYAALASRMFCNLSAAQQGAERKMPVCKQGFLGASL